MSVFKQIAITALTFTVLLSLTGCVYDKSTHIEIDDALSLLFKNDKKRFVKEEVDFACNKLDNAYEKALTNPGNLDMSIYTTDFYNMSQVISNQYGDGNLLETSNRITQSLNESEDILLNLENLAIQEDKEQMDTTSDEYTQAISLWQQSVSDCQVLRDAL